MKLLYTLIIFLIIGCGEKSTSPQSFSIVGVWEGYALRTSETDEWSLFNDINSENYDSTAFNRTIFFQNGNYTYESYSSALHKIQWGEYSIYNNYLTLFLNYEYQYDSENTPSVEDSTYVLNDIIEFEIELSDDELIWTGIVNNVYDSFFSAKLLRIE